MENFFHTIINEYNKGTKIKISRALKKMSILNDSEGDYQ